MSHGEAPVNESEKTLMDLYSQLSRIEELRQKLSQLQPLNYGEEKDFLRYLRFGTHTIPMHSRDVHSLSRKLL